MTTANVHAEASGALGSDAANLALTINARKPDGSSIMLPFTAPPSRVNTIALTGKVAPTSDAMRLELVGQVAGLQSGAVTIPGLGLSLAVEAKRDDPLAGGALPFALRLEADARADRDGADRIRRRVAADPHRRRNVRHDDGIRRDDGQTRGSRRDGDLHRHRFGRRRQRQDDRGFRRPPAAVAARRTTHLGSAHRLGGRQAVRHRDQPQGRRARHQPQHRRRDGRPSAGRRNPTFPAASSGRRTAARRSPVSPSPARRSRRPAT